MKMLEIEKKDGLHRITEAEAEEFLTDGVNVILQSSDRDFYEIDDVRDLENSKRLFDMNIYSKFLLFIE